MQFIANGPEVPENLLQAHEDGRVVFFCGAGISYPAGLPLFKGLVQEIFERTGMSMDRLERSAFDSRQYDVALDLLEHRHRGGRLVVRRAMADALKPKLRRAGATDTHEALLHLARDRSGSLRLLTTNFDQIFETIAKRLKLQHNVFSAPMLPIPKSSRWDGLVYLHGLQPRTNDDAALNRLVVTSGDFGLAYLTERWAARFVTELFRNYVVCFVGYGINDPVLRYMMDALAADRLLGEQTPQAYAFGSCVPESLSSVSDDWRAKGVEPILYTVTTRRDGKEDHSALPKTLQAWARTYRAGAIGKESIVVEHALTNPSESTPQDDFVGRMLWALSHPGGLPAKRFAEMEPTPPITWLSAFSDERFGHADLNRFGVSPNTSKDEKLRFSLICRPTAYQFAPQMALVSHVGISAKWDLVMQYLAQWLIRHLGDPRLLLWMAERGSRLHPSLNWEINDALKRYEQLEFSGDTEGLDLVRRRSPNAMPGPSMRKLWRLYLNGKIKSQIEGPDLFNWTERFKREGLNTGLRMELRELLSPQIQIQKAFRLNDGAEAVDEMDRINRLVDCEIVLRADHVNSQLFNSDGKSLLNLVLPALRTDLEQLLRDALDLMAELGEANEHSDRSNWDLPSISSHWQNRGYREWVTLIELLRDSWLGIHQNDSLRSLDVARGWFAQPYATFKRLALFAASQAENVTSDEWTSWLSSDQGRWLWAPDTKRECMRLLVLKGAHQSPTAQAQLEAAILGGPPRDLFRNDIELDAFHRIADSWTWLRLAKLESSGIRLGADAQARLAQLSSANPELKLQNDQSDEFSHWMSGTGDPDYEERRKVDVAPRKRKELVLWLKRSEVPSDPFYEDTWRDVCRYRFFHSALALKDLAAEGTWPVDRWREALQVWSEDGRARRSWIWFARLIEHLPDVEFSILSRSIAWWLEAVAKSVDTCETAFLALCDRVLSLEHEDGIQTDNPVSRAINHPVGHVTQALISYWFRREPNDGDGLPLELAPFFTRLCAASPVQYRHGRVIMTSRLIAFFRIDGFWTEQWLLPLLDWNNDPAEARATWEGFLWSPRLYQPLLIAFKRQFLATAQHYELLGEHGGQFAAFLTYAALDPVEGISVHEFREAIGLMPPKGLHQVAQTISHAQQGAGERREEYWKSRLLPFWQKIWPKDRAKATPAMTDALACLCIYTGDEFLSALREIVDWLMPMEHPSNIVRQMLGLHIAQRFPAESLLFLDSVVGDSGWSAQELRECLNEIESTTTGARLEDDHRFARLAEYCRLRGK